MNTISDEVVDRHLDAVLRASGSALRHYSMQKSLDDMRAAMRAAMAAPKPGTAELFIVAQQHPTRPEVSMFTTKNKREANAYKSIGWTVLPIHDAPAENNKPATHPNGAPLFSSTTFKDNGEPIMLNDDGTRSIFCDVDDECDREGEPA